MGRARIAFAVAVTALFLAGARLGADERPALLGVAFPPGESAGEPLRRVSFEGKVVVEVYTSGVALPEDLGRDLVAAVVELERHFGALTRPVRIRVGKGLVFGYDRAAQAVNVPPARNLVNHGLDARDVLDHEIVHAVVHQRLPERLPDDLRGDEEAVAIHEGVADYFAYLRDENDVFGDRCYADRSFLRRYRTAFQYPLVVGPHAKGNALTDYLIRKDTPFDALAAVFRSGPFSMDRLVAPGDREEFGLDPATRPEVAYGVRGKPPSTLHRYTVASGDVVEFRMNGACTERFGILGIAFTDKDRSVPRRFRFDRCESEAGTAAFRVEVLGSEGFEKILVWYASRGEVVGFGVLYLRVAR